MERKASARERLPSRARNMARSVWQALRRDWDLFQRRYARRSGASDLDSFMGLTQGPVHVRVGIGRDNFLNEDLRIRTELVARSVRRHFLPYVRFEFEPRIASADRLDDAMAEHYQRDERARIFSDLARRRLPELEALVRRHDRVVHVEP